MRTRLKMPSRCRLVNALAWKNIADFGGAGLGRSAFCRLASPRYYPDRHHILGERGSAPSGDSETTRALSGGRSLCGFCKDGTQQLGGEGMRATLSVPNCKPYLLFRITALRRDRDAGVIPDDIETVLVAKEGLGAAF